MSVYFSCVWGMCMCVCVFVIERLVCEGTVRKQPFPVMEPVADQSGPPVDEAEHRHTSDKPVIANHSTPTTIHKKKFTCTALHDSWVTFMLERMSLEVSKESNS